MSRINELISHYPEDKRKSALLPVLHEVQDAHDNWLSIELMDKVAEILILPIEVYEVVYVLHDVQPETYWEIHVRILSNLTLLFEWCRRFDGLYL
jgi:NADH:ubiquinone oxidoreductase subunit E